MLKDYEIDTFDLSKYFNETFLLEGLTLNFLNEYTE